MDTALFEGWFHEKFTPYVKKFCRDQGMEYKVLLLQDNAPAHPSSIHKAHTLACTFPFMALFPFT